MFEQLEMKHRKKDIILEKKLENSLENYISDLYLFERYTYKRCWKTKVIALETYLVFKSKSARLEAMKVLFLGGS